MVDHEAGQLVQTGNVVSLSRREVEEVVAKLERYEATNHPSAKSDENKARLAAYRQLLTEAEAGQQPAGAKKRS
jgi:hypothetical protein